MKLKTFRNHFTGIMIYDPMSGDTLYRLNSDKYFTPASNTKIFTLYTSLLLLPKQIPALKYCNVNDTLFIEGTGNPSLLHPYLKDSSVARFLKGFKNISLHQNNFTDSKFGPGWAWEDYDGYYSAERSALPIYGNVVTIFNSDSLHVIPNYFMPNVALVKNTINRENETNTFYFDPTRKDTLEIPFKTDSTVIKTLLEKALGREISVVQKMPCEEKIILSGILTDSINKRMMQESDNFLAEQLLLLASSTLSDTLNTGTAIEYMLKNHLKDLKQLPRWVDGSGLSRYNLFSPEAIVYVLSAIHREVPKERLFHLFAEGGESGTISDWYPGNPQPYIYAKTGTLGNNHNISGYLITKSGKTLIFSFMNNHFTNPASEIKKQMQYVFEWIRDNY
ncbi:D-alanyl-D-alanine carboxypeptidase [uncultured Eudoraea sp.]|uniref:D-alanyl-D-alanine carboxypeptidase n=1 Tax=uncultured Eudoraea sp. TaxID=1035614 RepID=UPI0026100D2E|nr:D-alanyl-D-alanine carboxypeptidase [uncultured Eudoraea sp.]